MIHNFSSEDNTNIKSTSFISVMVLGLTFKDSFSQSVKGNRSITGPIILIVMFINSSTIRSLIMSIENGKKFMSNYYFLLPLNDLIEFDEMLIFLIDILLRSVFFLSFWLILTNFLKLMNSKVEYRDTIVVLSISTVPTIINAFLSSLTRIIRIYDYFQTDLILFIWQIVLMFFWVSQLISSMDKTVKILVSAFLLSVFLTVITFRIIITFM